MPSRITDEAIAETCSAVDALWVAYDQGRIGLETVLDEQHRADGLLTWWAAHHGLPCGSSGELVDALSELRRLNAERLRME